MIKILNNNNKNKQEQQQQQDVRKWLKKKLDSGMDQNYVVRKKHLTEKQKKVQVSLVIPGKKVFF